MFIYLLLSFKSTSYIFNNSLLSYVSFESMFSQSLACLLIHLAFTFVEKKFLTLMKSSLSIVSFIGFTQGHLGILLCYLLAGFIVLCFTFKSMIHFQLINMKDVRSSCMLMSTCSSTICWKDYLCFIVLSLPPCQRSVH